MPDFTLMDKIVDLKKFTFEEAARIATVEKWNSYIGLGWSQREWSQAFYLMVKGENTTPEEFKAEGAKDRIFRGEIFNGDENKNFCIELQKKLAKANIRQILENHKYIRDGLLIIGVALYYVKGVEQYNKILTSHWIPKFYNFFKHGGHVLPEVKKYYYELEQDQRFLTYNDLDILNNQSWFESKI